MQLAEAAAVTPAEGIAGQPPPIIARRHSGRGQTAAATQAGAEPSAAAMGKRRLEDASLEERKALCDLALVGRRVGAYRAP